MKSFLASAALLGALTSAAPTTLTGAQDTFNDMQDAIDGQGDCAPAAVIFARGTFDSGNAGVWVGPDWFNALAAAVPGLAKQGVDAEAYPADLKGYLEQGGSDDGAASMADTITRYSAKCPDAKIIASGWSQGAQVAHKSLFQLSPEVQSKVAAVAVFGDPFPLFDSGSPVPDGIDASKFKSYCITGSVFDPLCAQLPSDFKMPTSASDIIGPFKSLPSVAQGVDQAAAAMKLVLDFPAQLIQGWSGFVSSLNPGQFQRLLLSPQHFQYGNNGMTKQAANDVAALLG